MIFLSGATDEYTLVFLLDISRPQTTEHLNRLIPKSVRTFQLFVTDDVLLYSLVTRRVCSSVLPTCHVFN